MTTTKTKHDVLEETRTKLIAKLQESGWGEVLRLFLHSEDFSKIFDTLYKQVAEDKRFTPPLKHVFRAFEQCPWSKTKVVMIGQDPYFTPGVADGIAFSCGLTGKAQPSLKYMFDAIEKQVYQEFPTHQDPDLTRWANQGVLLLNSALTVQMNKPGTHYDIWKDFLVYVIDQICSKKDDVVFVLLGKQAETFKEFIDKPFMSTGNHKVIIASHPASAAYQKAREWNGGFIFNEVNEFLKTKGKSIVSW